MSDSAASKPAASKPAAKPAESKPAAKVAESTGSSSAGGEGGSSSSGASPKGTSLHSSDIAFKPNDDGWGYTPSYASGWDRIFKKGATAPEAEAKPAPGPKPAVDVLAMIKQQEALRAAHACGALSDALYAQATEEIKAKSS